MKMTKMREWNEKVCYGFLCTAIGIMALGFVVLLFFRS